MDQKIGLNERELKVPRLWLKAASLSHFLLSSRFLLHSSRTIARTGWTGLGVRARTDIFNKRGRAMEDRLLYRVPEVAVILNISRSKVYELFSSGDLESVKIDRIRLVRSSDLRAYVDQLHAVDKSA
jgi:excisionase family DNA binding protein